MFNQKKSKLMQTKGQLMKSLHTAFSFAPPSILSLTICYSHDIIFFFNYIHLILIHCLSTCFCNQHPVNLLLHCFLCIFIEMITDNIDCLPDFLCKCVTLCFCIHHFSFLLEPQQRVIPLVSVRTLFFQSGPKWALPVS